MTGRTTPTRRDRIILRTATPAGLVLLMASLLGNYTGWTVLPVDQHHLIGQVGGFGLVFCGLMHWLIRWPHALELVGAQRPCPAHINNYLG